MKQTAVEWLQQKLLDNGVILVGSDYELIEQAKEMEKEQMQDLFKAGVNYGAGYVIATEQGEENTKPNFYNYYNETFKSE
jgi:hypothetical protein